MTALATIRAALTAALLSATLGLTALPAQAQDGSDTMEVVGDTGASTPVSLGVNKSVVIELPRPAGDVLVSNPAIADAVLRTSRRLYLIGVKLGQANVFLFDQAGDQIASFDVYVEADLTSLNELLAEAIPNGYVRAEAMNGNIVLRGQVSSASEASRAQEITVGMLDGFSAGTEDGGGGAGGAGGAAGGGGEGGGKDDSEKNVVNLLTITGEEQVALKVTIAEVEREVIKQFGININAAVSADGFNLGSESGGLSPLGPSLGVRSQAGQISIGYSGAEGGIEATLQALDETNMIRTLAEPTLTAVSGETAHFHAGGEFGYQTIDIEDDDDGEERRRVRVAFKPFGVELAFTPVVLSGGRISMRLRTEVSEIAGTTFGIPFLNTREAETTVELPSGGAFVIAGLIQEQTRRAATGFPGLQRIPVLGALFSSKEFRSEQTELVIVVTPYLVKPVLPKDLARPDDNLMLAGDAEAYFKNKLTKVYGSATHIPEGTSGGPVGFTFD